MAEAYSTGTILQGIGGFYTALDEDGREYILRAQGKLRRERMKPKVGDRVELIPGEGEEHGWICRILPRRNELVRPPVANIDVIVIVVAAATPDPDLMMVDRLMLNARRAGIAVQLVINKSDLSPDNAGDIVRQYRGAEVSPLQVCAATGAGMEALRERLRGRIHALAGQSGAGKSTMINALYGLDLETGDLSRKIDRGKNTTRHCQLIPVEGGGMVLDTPGFSLLESGVFDPVELKDSWPEFTPYEGQCYFQPCYHATEPRCAVLDAVAAGKIDDRRHGRYIALLDEMKLRWRDRYD
ncbi:MAG: ribosome small subunit-dependent GTPase A [Clostridia bacterium]|nr:ribosome small subunit-dependent GTPase A [Clostridia bacterium]